MVIFEISHIVMIPGLFEYFLENWCSQKKCFFDESVTITPLPQLLVTNIAMSGSCLLVYLILLSKFVRVAQSKCNSRMHWFLGDFCRLHK